MENETKTNSDTKKLSRSDIVFVIFSSLVFVVASVIICFGIFNGLQYDKLDTYAYFTIDNQSYLLEIESYTKNSTTYELKFSDNSYLTISKENCLIYKGVLSD